MIDAHEITANITRNRFSYKYNPFTLCDRLLLKNYQLTIDLVRQLVALGYIIHSTRKVFVHNNFRKGNVYKTYLLDINNYQFKINLL